MLKFPVLTRADGGESIWVNPLAVKYFLEQRPPPGTELFFSDSTNALPLCVKESPYIVWWRLAGVPAASCAPAKA